MITEALQQAVEVAFDAAGGGALQWPAPHPDRSPTDDEYSRVTAPERYRLLGLRADAWVTALSGAGLATAEPVVDVDAAWVSEPWGLAEPAQAVLLRPHRAGAVPLLLCRSRVGQEAEGDHEVLLVGAGEPAVVVAVVPDCGCDACDSGSADLLEGVDRTVLDVVTGAFAHVTTPDGVVSGTSDGWATTSDGADALPTWAVDELLDDARAGRSPHPVVHGLPWG